MRRLGSLLVLSTLVGCKPAATPLALGDVSAAPAAAVHGMGTLRIAVKWPARSLSGFNAQAVPYSSNALVLDVVASDDATVSHVVITRNPSGLATARDIAVPVGEGYSMRARAYAETEPTAQSQVLAEGLKTGLTVEWGRLTPVQLVLDATFAPRITSLTPANAGGGTWLTIEGENLIRGATTSYVVFPGGFLSTAIASGSGLAVRVPFGAGTGEVALQSDGVVGTVTAPFREITMLSYAANDAIPRLKRNADLESWLGDELDLTVAASDSARQRVTDPTITGWVASGSAGVLTSAGHFQARELGEATVSVLAGLVQYDNVIEVGAGAGARLSPTTGSAASASVVPFGGGWLAAWYAPDGQKVYTRSLTAVGAHTGSPAEAASASQARTWLATTANVPVLGVSPARVVLFDGSGGALSPISAPTDAGASSNALALAGADSAAGMIYRHAGSSLTERRLWVFAPQSDGTLNNSATVSLSPGTGRTWPDAEGLASIAGYESNFVIAQQATVTAGGFEHRLSRHDASTGVALVSTSSPPRLAADVIAVGTNGSGTLIAAVEASESSRVLALYRYDSSLSPLAWPSNGQGRLEVADLGMASVNPNTHPISIVWTGHEFIVGFTQRRTDTRVAPFEIYDSAMIQAVLPDGTLEGHAFSLGEGSGLELGASSEGGLGIWNQPDGSLVVRRIRYR